MGKVNIDTVREWVTTNDFFKGNRVEQGRDVFVPSNNKYPHVHIGTNFITSSKSPSNHSELVDAQGTVNNGRVLTCNQDTKSAEVMQLCRYLISQQT